MKTNAPIFNDRIRLPIVNLVIEFFQQCVKITEGPLPMQILGLCKIALGKIQISRTAAIYSIKMRKHTTFVEIKKAGDPCS